MGSGSVTPLSERRCFWVTIWASLLYDAVSIVVLKVLVVVLIRKSMQSIEDSVVGSSSKITAPSSEFWQGLFLDDWSFNAVLAFAVANSAFLAIVIGAIDQGPRIIASKNARLRRSALMDIPLKDLETIDVSDVLAQINFCFRFETDVYLRRLQAISRIASSIIFGFIVFPLGASLVTFALVLGMIITKLPWRKRLVERERREVTEIQNSEMDVLRNAEFVVLNGMAASEEARIEQIAVPKTSDKKTLGFLRFMEFVPLGVVYPLIVLVADTLISDADSASERFDLLFATVTLFLVFTELQKASISLTETQERKIAFDDAIKEFKRLGIHWATSNRVGPTEEEEFESGQLKNDHEEVHLVKVDSMSIAFGDRYLFRNLSFSFNKGESLGIVGASGRGKSTICRAFVGLVPFESGQIRCNGRVIASKRDMQFVRSRSIFVSQDSQLFHRSVRENVAFGCTHIVSDDNIVEALEKASMLPWLNTLANGLDTILATEKTVSGGEAQRLHLARMFCRNADIVILDEAMSALDEGTRDRVLGNIHEFCEEKCCIVVSHHLHVVERLCKWVLNMEEKNQILAVKDFQKTIFLK